MAIKFHKSVLKAGKDQSQVVQTVIGKTDPTTVEAKVNKAREFLASRGIKNMKPLYASIGGQTSWG